MFIKKLRCCDANSQVDDRPKLSAHFYNALKHYFGVWEFSKSHTQTNKVKNHVIKRNEKIDYPSSFLLSCVFPNYNMYLLYLNTVHFYGYKNNFGNILQNWIELFCNTDDISFLWNCAVISQNYCKMYQKSLSHYYESTRITIKK